MPPLTPMMQSKSRPTPCSLISFAMRSSVARPLSPVSQLGSTCA